MTGGASDRSEGGESRRILVVGATGTVGSAVCAALVEGRGSDAESDAGERDDGDADAGNGNADPDDADVGNGNAGPDGPDPWLRGYDWPALPSGVTVRAATRRPDEATVTADECVDFDYARPETWGAALTGVDGLFLMYPPGSDTGPVTAFADAAARVGVDRIAFLSALNAGDLPVLPHRRIERHLADLPVGTTTLRAGYFHQNLAEVHAADVRERGEVFVPAGDARTTFVDARDVGAAAAVRLAGGREPSTGPNDLRTDYLGGEVLTYGDVARALSDAIGRNVRYTDPSPIAFARRMRRRGHPWPFVAFMLAQYTIARYRLVPVDRTSDDLERLLGREPTTFRAFARDYRPVWAST